jgi:predicted transcriptional regulator
MAITDTTPSNILEVIMQRSDFLQCMVDRPRKKPILAKELGVSRSTVDRAMSKLETTDLIESCDDGYQVTSIGKLVTTNFLAFMSSVEEATQKEERTPSEVPALEVVDAVSSRRQFLETLQEEPKDKRTLVNELGMSRSTVDRSLRELETLDLVEYSDGDFAVTAVGQLATDGLTELTGTIGLGQRLEAFLQWIPMEEFDLDVRLLADAELIVAEPGDPWSMINKHVQLVKTMENCRALLPFTGLHAHEAGHEQVIKHDASGELVVEPEIANVHHSTPEYAEFTEEMVATGRFEYFEYPNELPYALAIINDTVQIVVSEGDEPRALLETDNDEVRDWAEAKYDEYKQQSGKIT